MNGRATASAEAIARILASETLLLLKPGPEIPDLLAATPVFRNLRRALPRTRLLLVVEHRCLPAVLGNPDLDLVAGAGRGGLLGIWDRWRLVGRLKAEGPGAALVLGGTRGAVEATALARRAAVPLVAGMDEDEDAAAFDLRLPPPEEGRAHVVDRHLTLVEDLGLPIREREHRLGVTAEERTRGTELLAAAGADPRRPVLGAFVGGTPLRPERQWAPPHYASVLQRAAKELGFQPVLLGGKADAPSMDQVIALGTTPIPKLVDLGFADLKGVLAAMTFFITHDGEPMHVAAALGVPSYFVFLSTPPWRWAPYGAHVAVWEDDGRPPNPSEVWDRMKPLLDRARQERAGSGDGMA